MPKRDGKNTKVAPAMDGKRLARASAREAAYLACLELERHGQFIQQSLELWALNTPVDARDHGLALEIALGSTRMRRALEARAEQLASSGSLKLKRKERLLLYCALYQLYYLDRVPAYAVVDESIKIAKKHCHDRFAKFLNGVLRKVDPAVALDATEAVKLSYPDWLTTQLEHETLSMMNKAPRVFARQRNSNPLEMVEIQGREALAMYADEPGYYIQNPTPAILLTELCKAHEGNSERILDLCAAPGGKTLILHEQFPKATLVANDRSEERSERLKENLRDRDIEIQVTCQDGSAVTADELYDLVVIDAPCSNAGVLHKRPEARWRLSEESVRELVTLQTSLIEHAGTIVKPGGHVWYMTCSILPQENQQLIDALVATGDWERAGYERLITPNEAGWDGGYACALRRQG